MFTPELKTENLSSAIAVNGADCTGDVLKASSPSVDNVRISSITNDTVNISTNSDSNKKTAEEKSQSLQGNLTAGQPDFFTSHSPSPLLSNVTNEQYTNSITISKQCRSIVLIKFRKRNLKETAPFIDIIKDHEQTANHVEVLRKKTVNLQLETERLRQDLKDLPSGSGQGSADSALRNEISELEKKLYETQYDLTTALRTKDESNQKVLQLNEKLREKDDQVVKRDQRIRELESELHDSKCKIEDLMSKIESLEECKQAQADEYSALALSCTQFEQRLLASENENRRVVREFLQFKQKYADELNKETETEIEQRRQKERRETQRQVDDLGVDLIAKRNVEPAAIILASDIPNSPRAIFDAHEDEVTCVRFLTNDTFLTGGVDRHVKIWNPCLGVQVSHLSTLSGSNAGITCIDVDGQENYIVASSYDHSSRIWSLRDRRLKHSLTGHNGKVMAARFIGEDSYKVASGSHDRTIKVWDLKQLACARVLHCHSSCTDLLAVDSSVLCSGHIDKRVRFWDIRSNKSSDLSTNELLLSAKVTSLDASRDRRDVLTCTKDGQLKVIDLRNMSVKSTLVSDSLRIGADYCRASLSPDGRFAMVGSNDGSVLVFDVNTQKVDRILKSHQSMVLCTTWSHDGTKLLTSDKNKKVIMWSDR